MNRIDLRKRHISLVKWFSAKAPKWIHREEGKSEEEIVLKRQAETRTLTPTSHRSQFEMDSRPNYKMYNFQKETQQSVLGLVGLGYKVVSKCAQFCYLSGKIKIVHFNLHRFYLKNICGLLGSGWGFRGDNKGRMLIIPEAKRWIHGGTSFFLAFLCVWNCP